MVDKLRSFVPFLLIIILAVPLAGWWFVQRPLSYPDAYILMPELESTATVRLDSRGIPYVEAGSESDLYMAQGYMMAHERLFQMDMLRRKAEGKLSEVFGMGCLPADKLMRTIGFARLAANEAAQLSPGARSMLESFCRGINIYLRLNHDRLPLEFSLLNYTPSPWRPEDSLAIMKHQAYTLDQSWQLDDLRQRVLNKVGEKQAAQLFQDEYPAGSLSQLPQSALDFSKKAGVQLSSLTGQGCPRPSMGSTSWAVSGKHTDTGGAILSCAKDEALSCPDLWYMCSLAAPGFHCAGATIAGVPGVMLGRNDQIAWCGSELKADVQDLVLEEFSPRFPDRSRTVDGWQTATEISEDIPVRFSPDVIHKVTITRHGPILVKNGTNGIALAWTGNASEHPALDSYYLLDRANNWQEFVQALKDYPGSPQTFLFANRQGQIGYQAAGDVPVRANKGSGTSLVIGWLLPGQWTAKLPFEDLPSAFNPASGFLVAANQKLADKDRPWLIGHQWCPPYRASRLESYFADLSSKGWQVGLPDMNDLQADQASALGLLVKRELSQALSQAQVIDRFQLAAFDRLQHWDCTLKGDGGAIYESFLRTLAYRLLTPKLGKETTQEYLDRWPMWICLVERYLKDKPDGWLPPEERSHQAFMLSAFVQSLKSLRLAQASDDPSGWSWQAVHKATFQHPIAEALPALSGIFDVGPVPAGGDADSIDMLDIAGDTTSGRFAGRTGSTMHLLVDASDSDKIYQSLSLGQSGQLFAKTARDELKAWLRVDPLPLAFSPAQLDRISDRQLILINRLPSQ